MKKGFVWWRGDGEESQYYYILSMVPNTVHPFDARPMRMLCCVCLKDGCSSEIEEPHKPFNFIWHKTFSYLHIKNNKLIGRSITFREMICVGMLNIFYPISCEEWSHKILNLHYILYIRPRMLLFLESWHHSRGFWWNVCLHISRIPLPQPSLTPRRGVYSK